MTIPTKCKLCNESDIKNFRIKIIRKKTYYEKLCRSCEAKKALKYYYSNKEKITSYQKKYNETNKEIIREKKKKNLYFCLRSK